MRGPYGLGRAGGQLPVGGGEVRGSPAITITEQGRVGFGFAWLAHMLPHLCLCPGFIVIAVLASNSRASKAHRANCLRR